jgi:hypothetical protein
MKLSHRLSVESAAARRAAREGVPGKTPARVVEPMTTERREEVYRSQGGGAMTPRQRARADRKDGRADGRAARSGE